MNLQRLEKMLESASEKEFMLLAKLHMPALLRIWRLAEATSHHWQQFGSLGGLHDRQDQIQAALKFAEEVGTVPLESKIV